MSDLLFAWSFDTRPQATRGPGTSSRRQSRRAGNGVSLGRPWFAVAAVVVVFAGLYDAWFVYILRQKQPVALWEGLRRALTGAHEQGPKDDLDGRS